MHDESGVISSGSGFFYEYSSQTFLITNWHNVTGRNFLTRDPISRRAPTYIMINLATKIDEEGGFFMIPHKIDLYAADDANPTWLEHPRLANLCDAVAIPFALPPSTPSNLHVPVNRIHKIRIPVRPGVTVFILGYPRNLSVHIGWPIWKSGYIASEPHYDVTIGGTRSARGYLQGGHTLPAFFIDSLTRKGMSGAPVFANYIGNWDMNDPYREVNPEAPGFGIRDDVAIGENRMEFVGIYSSRVPTEEGEAALGLCFRSDAIDEVCANEVRAKHPHVI